MKAQLLMGIPLVIVRSQSGQVAALRDLCPHRAMPLSFGRFENDSIACGYHGWQFNMEGRCRLIPALIGDGEFDTQKIGVTKFPCQEADGYVWVYIPEHREPPASLPEPPSLPVLSDSYALYHLALPLTSGYDNAVLGLIDPAHGPYIHQNIWWRNRNRLYEKTKVYEPLPIGFRMKSHTPSQNSKVTQLLGLTGDPVSITIDFHLPSIRIEEIRGGKYWFVSRLMVTPISEDESRLDFCAAWNCLRWVPFHKTIFGLFTKHFLNQDKKAMLHQAIGLRQKPTVMFFGDADMPAKWYFKLKAAYRAARHNGGHVEHPLTGPVTLRWRT